MLPKWGGGKIEDIHTKGESRSIPAPASGLDRASEPNENSNKAVVQPRIKELSN